MTTEPNTPRQDVQRGQEAAQVLDNVAFKEALEDLRLIAIDRWKNCDLADVEQQRLALQFMKVTDLFEGLLRGRIEKGKLAQHHLNEEELRRERSKTMFGRALNSIR